MFATPPVKNKHRIGRSLCLENPRPKGGISPLRQGCLLIFTLNQNKYYPDLAGPDFPIGPVFDRMISEVARAGGTYDEESLSGLVNHMIEVDTARLDAARNKINVP